MADSYVGIDVGTSSSKAVVIGPGGAVLGVGSERHDTLRPRDGWTEQRPSDWWRTTCGSVRAAMSDSGIDASRVGGIGLSGQMHGSVLLDGSALEDAGRRAIDAVRPALLWNDQRTAEQCARIAGVAGGVRSVVEATGNAPLTGLTAPKLLWVREHEPELWGRVAGVCLPKDFVRLCMTGVLAGDVSDCSGTLLFDPARRGWNTELAAALEIDHAVLPEVMESAAPAGALTAWAAAELGLQAGVVVAAGAGDNQAGAVGAGVVRPGVAYASVGTSGVIFVHSDRPRMDLEGTTPGRVQSMCAADGSAGRSGEWSVSGCMLSAAGALEWARGVLAPEASFDSMLAEASAVPPGCDGLLFAPYLSGERCPHPDPAARGAWVGLTAAHTRGHLIRAVLEGVTFGMDQMLSIVRGLGVSVDEVRLSGGGARSPLWRQLQADVYGVPVLTLTAEEGAAFGAALLAGVAGGRWPSVRDACSEACGVGARIDPGDDARRYHGARAMYDDLYGSIASLAHRQSAASGR